MSGTKSGSVRRYDTRQRKPCSDWKVAREGGIGCVVPGVEQYVPSPLPPYPKLTWGLSELFFADRSSLVGALDLRTGRLLYSYPSITCTAHHLLPIPSPASGLATISSDATLRLHSTVPPRAEGMKGNAGGEGRKPKVLGMVGGVGVGNAVWRGFGEMPDELGERGVVFSGEEEGGEMGDEEVWEEMSEVEDLGSSEEEDEGDIPPKRSRK